MQSTSPSNCFFTGPSDGNINGIELVTTEAQYVATRGEGYASGSVPNAVHRTQQGWRISRAVTAAFNAPTGNELTAKTLVRARSPKTKRGA